MADFGGDDRSDPAGDGDGTRQRRISPYNFAVVYAGLGDKDQAFKWLDKAYEESDPSLVVLKVAPWLDNLRSDPRFSSLTRNIGFPQ